ncbi:MAG: FKBP-type peptidyl-prolyl cis-trans isomerase [Anaerolineae bacterium]
MKLRILLIILALAILPACGGAATEEAGPAPTEPPAAEEAAPTEAPAQADTGAEAAPDAPPSPADTAAGADLQTTDSGLQYAILQEGSGNAPQPGELVSVHYTGGLEDGTIFDSSIPRGEPITFVIGAGQVIPGWDEGIALLKEGSKGVLAIPPELAYGEAGAGGVIPPNATLYFEVELVGIEPAPPPPPEAPSEVSEADYTTTESGLKYFDIEEGDGPSPEVGSMVSVHYTGWLEDGTMFDSSLLRAQPFAFPVGMQQVIPGWDEGVGSMKVGGKRQLVIPPDLAYGEQGAGGVIPPDATLIFEVELLGIQ